LTTLRLLLFPYTTLFRSSDLYPGRLTSHPVSRPGSCAAGSVRPRHLPPHPPAAKVRVSIYGRGVTSQKTDTSAVDDEPEVKLNRDRKSTRLNSSHVSISY